MTPTKGISWIVFLAVLFSQPEGLQAQDAGAEWKTYDISFLLQPLIDGENPTLWGTHIRSPEPDRKVWEKEVEARFLVPQEKRHLFLPNELISFLQNSPPLPANGARKG